MAGKYKVLKDGVEVMETTSRALAEKTYARLVNRIGDDVDSTELVHPPYAEGKEAPR